MKGDDQVFVPDQRVAFRKIDGQFVLIHVLEDRLVTLNETGTFIWELLDGRSVVQIAGEIEKRFEVSPDEALGDTRDFLNELERQGFVRADSAEGEG